MDNQKLTEEQLKRQAIFRIVVFFLIVVALGYWASAIGAMMQEKSMFEISEATKAAAVEAMEKVLEDRGYEEQESVDSDTVELMFDAAVAVVKKQFGF